MTYLILLNKSGRATPSNLADIVYAQELPIADEREMQRSLLASMLGTAPPDQGAPTNTAEENGGYDSASEGSTGSQGQGGSELIYDSGDDDGDIGDSGDSGNDADMREGMDGDGSSQDDDAGSVDDLIDSLPVARSDLAKVPSGDGTATASAATDKTLSRRPAAANQGRLAAAAADTSAVAAAVSSAVVSAPAVRQLTDAQRLLQRQAAQMLAPARPPKAPDMGDAEATTVFVRGLPAAATEAVLRSVMSKFGPLKACRCRLSLPLLLCYITACCCCC